MEDEFIPNTVDALHEAGIDFASGLHDGWLGDIHVSIQDDSRFTYVPVCNEDVGFSTCVGAWFGGKKPVLIMENSGLRTAAESMARLNLSSGGGGGSHGVGVVILASYRGDLGETAFWAKNHGITCESLLDTLRIPYTVVRDAENLDREIDRASKTAFNHVTPAAVLVGGGVMGEGNHD